MKKSSILLFISGVMFVIAAVFVFYALGYSSEGSFRIPLFIVKAFYKLYALTDIVLFVTGIWLKQKNK